MPPLFGRPRDNKGKRVERAKLHPVVVEHLRELAGFDLCVFPWLHNESVLYRQFATVNSDRLTPDTLQALMWHKSYQTTQESINPARRQDEAVASLHVPTC